MLNIAILIAAFILLIKSADILVGGAADLGAKFNIPNLIMGLTVVAFGTSAPELAVSVSAAFGEHTGLIVGNVIGSNLVNTTLGIGISALLLTLTINKATFKELLILVVSLVLLFLLFTKGSLVGPFYIGRWEGIVLLIGFLLFMFHVYLDAMKGKRTIILPPVKEQKCAIPIVGQLLFGVVGLCVGGYLVVNQCVSLGRMFDISESVVGLTIIAVGTSLPDITTSIVAAYRGNDGVAIGNLIGSNVFNILLILGVSGVLSTKGILARNLEIDFVVMVLAVMIVYLGALYFRKIGKTIGLLLILVYVLYMSWMVLNAR